MVAQTKSEYVLNEPQKGWILFDFHRLQNRLKSIENLSQENIQVSLQPGLAGQEVRTPYSLENSDQIRKKLIYQLINIFIFVFEKSIKNCFKVVQQFSHERFLDKTFFDPCTKGFDIFNHLLMRGLYNLCLY